MSKQPTRRRRATGAAVRTVAVGVAVAALVWSAATLLAAVALTRARVAGLALEPSLGRFPRRGHRESPAPWRRSEVALCP